jgi:hypothetical protein
MHLFATSTGKQFLELGTKAAGVETSPKRKRQTGGATRSRGS